MRRKVRSAAQALAWLGTAGATAQLRRCLARVTEPAILFPALAILVLGVVWGATLNLIKVERAAAEHTAVVSSDELAETYEAQVVRALREIDLTLKFVKYAYERRGSQAVLQELKDKSLLPPVLLFVVSIADSTGNVVASTKPTTIANIADQDYFQTSRQIDAQWNRDIIALCFGDKGEGWVEYDWVHPVTKKLESKSSFVKRVPGTNYLVGVGIYR